MFPRVSQDDLLQIASTLDSRDIFSAHSQTKALHQPTQPLRSERGEAILKELRPWAMARKEPPALTFGMSHACLRDSKPAEYDAEIRAVYQAVRSATPLDLHPMAIFPATLNGIGFTGGGPARVWTPETGL